MPKVPSGTTKDLKAPKEAKVSKEPKEPGDAPKTKRKSARSTARKGGSAKKGKRALSAYMFFSQDWRERIKNENPDAGFGEIGKLLGAKWKEMDDEEKKPYTEQAAADKIRVETEKEQLVEDKPKAASPVEEDEEE